MTDHPTAPVRDDDAELVRQLRSWRFDSAGNLGKVARGAADAIERLSPTPETDRQEQGVPASPSGCQPSASNLRFSHSGIPNAEDFGNV